MCEPVSIGREIPCRRKVFERRMWSAAREAKRSGAHLVAVHLRIGSAVVNGHRLRERRRASAIELRLLLVADGIVELAAAPFDFHGHGAPSAGQPPCPSIYHRLNPSQAAVPARAARDRPPRTEPLPNTPRPPPQWHGAGARELRRYLRIRASEIGIMRGWRQSLGSAARSSAAWPCEPGVRAAAAA